MSAEKQLKMYEYPACGTCRNAAKWLQAEGWNVNKIHIREQPPTADELRKLISKSGLEIKKWFNTSGEVYKQQQLKDKLPLMSEEEKIELLASNGMLIKRPVVTDGDKVTVGFKPEMFTEAWSK